MSVCSSMSVCLCLVSLSVCSSMSVLLSMSLSLSLSAIYLLSVFQIMLVCCLLFFFLNFAFYPCLKRSLDVASGNSTSSSVGSELRPGRSASTPSAARCQGRRRSRVRRIIVEDPVFIGDGGGGTAGGPHGVRRPRLGRRFPRGPSGSVHRLSRRRRLLLDFIRQCPLRTDGSEPSPLFC